MIVLSPIQTKILSALGAYKFLTSKQIFRLIQNKNLQSIYNDLRKIKDREFIDAVVYGGVSKSGTMHKLHYLTKKGAQVVADMESMALELVKFPKSTNTLVKNDFHHRIQTIDLHIGYNEWITHSGATVLFQDIYFDKTGAQRNPNDGFLKGKTRISLTETSYIDPDGIFGHITKENVPEIFVLEVANGQNTERILSQIQNVLYACYRGHIANKYEIKTTPRLLVSFEHPSTLQSLLARFKKDTYLSRFEGVENYIFFGIHAETTVDFARSWKSLSGHSPALFPLA